ncbi:adenylyltransferase/cytidyltransferase family protein [Pseudomonadales bacterium]|nr:adenylyltransferase/cytidyltransferase family protein [Pseudomonadales bacterium]
MKRVLVDMSATILHHGHVRLLAKASEYGQVVVALTADSEILSKKGYTPEIAFEGRREILESIKYVDEVISSPWLIDEEFLDIHNIDYLVHGHDNSNPVAKEKLIIFPRTEGISSTKIRSAVLRAVAEQIMSAENP